MPSSFGAHFEHIPFIPEWLNAFPLPVIVLALWAIVPVVVIAVNVYKQLVSCLISHLEPSLSRRSTGPKTHPCLQWSSITSPGLAQQ